MLDDLLGGLLGGLLAGRRFAQASEAAAQRRLTQFRDGLWMFVPLELVLASGQGRGQVRRRFEVRVMAAHPRETAFGWWDEDRLGDRAAALLGTCEVAVEGWPGSAVRVGVRVRTGVGAAGGRFWIAVQPADWDILASVLREIRP